MNRFRKNNFRNNISGIGEQLKLSITKKLDQFLKDDNQKVLEFDSSLTSNERKYIHNYCVQFSLMTRSTGIGNERYLTVSKRDHILKDISKPKLNLSDESTHQIWSLIKYLEDNRDIDYRNRHSIQKTTKRYKNNYKSGHLLKVVPNVPQIKFLNSKLSANYQKFREELPIYQYRDDILRCVDSNQVVIISGDTGCGKTTQVPQYLLEYCAINSINCRIVCAEPRRLAAISVSERVSVERNEPLGQTVGYQIRLESKVSNDTLLTFCTNGVILRTLMFNQNELLSNLTHIIIDEVHERDRFSDFLLLILKNIMARYPHIRLILMSATFDTNRFSEYFGNCPVIEIPGKLFEVKTYFLEDVLKEIEYMTTDMAHYSLNLNTKQKRLTKDDNNCGNTSETPIKDVTKDVDNETKAKLDLCLKNGFMAGNDEAFEDLMGLLLNDKSLIDYQHSETGVTPLIAASGRNKVPIVEMLLELGPNVCLKTTNQMRAIDWAKYFGHEEVINILELYCSDNNIVVNDIPVNEDTIDVLTNEEKQLLDVYHNCFNDDEVDTDLICALMSYILKESEFGSILVFLPGFEDICRLQDSIINDTKRFDTNIYSLYLLHSQMQCSDQRRVFQSVPNNVRKLILSTNIAETSITIPDVVYVIDCGKVKEKSFDSLMGISCLKSVWISKSSVVQRRGRAGRTKNGICYHLFSKNRFENMQKHQLPEILRMPIHEVCLQTKLLSPNNEISIQEFLSSAMDPPSATSVRTSVQLLKTIDALNSTEQLTDLGICLLDLPVEPNYGKMILFSILLKCIDPIITIVSALTYRDPFIIPTRSDRKKIVNEIRNRYSMNSFSDHIIFLNVFNEYRRIQNIQNKRAFCSKNFLSFSSMELISGIRTQLLNQLKSSGFVRDIRDLNKNCHNWTVIKAALCGGAFPKLIRFDENNGHFVTQKDSKIRFHQSSQLGNNKRIVLPSQWLIYEEMILIGRTSSAKTCTSISPITVALFSGSIDYRNTESSSPNNVLEIDDWIAFKTNHQIVEYVSFLRQKLLKLFAKKIDRNSEYDPRSDDCIIDTVINILNAEEVESGYELIDLKTSFEDTYDSERFVPKYQSNQYHSQRQYRREKQRYVNKSNNLNFRK